MRYGLLFILALIAGCSHSYITSRNYTDTPIPKMASNGKVYIAISDPGGVEGKIYPESGRMTSAAIKDALTRYLAVVKTGRQPEDYDAALVSARQVDARYLILPKVQHWEDRATEWSGKPDKILVKIRIINVASGDPIDSIDISGTSKWFTFGGDHPQDLLEKPIGDYFTALFAE